MYSLKTANDSNAAHKIQHKIVNCASGCSTKVSFVFSMEVGMTHNTFYPLRMRRRLQSYTPWIQPYSAKCQLCDKFLRHKS